jgi:hypothetical protein
MKNVMVPDDVYQRASQLAEREHVSVDKLVAALVTEGIGEWSRCRASRRGVLLPNSKVFWQRVRDVSADANDLPNQS